MAKPAEVRAHLAGLAALTRPVAAIPREAPRRALSTILNEFRQAGIAVGAMAHAWATEPPESREALDSMQSHLVGMGRLVGELRLHLEGLPDGMA